jgi:hypothetical protein
VPTIPAPTPVDEARVDRIMRTLLVLIGRRGEASL